MDKKVRKKPSNSFECPGCPNLMEPTEKECQKCHLCSTYQQRRALQHEHGVHIYVSTGYKHTAEEDLPFMENARRVHEGDS